MLSTCWKCKKAVDSETVDLEETVGLCASCFDGYGTEEHRTAAVDFAMGPDEAHAVVLNTETAQPTVIANVTRMEAGTGADSHGDFAQELSKVVTTVLNDVKQGKLSASQAVDEIREASIDLLLRAVPPGIPKPSREVVGKIVDDCLQVHIEQPQPVTVSV
jgi:hypothetical protein